MQPSARRVNDLSLTREAPLNFGRMSTRAHRGSRKRVREHVEALDRRAPRWSAVLRIKRFNGDDQSTIIVSIDNQFPR